MMLFLLATLSAPAQEYVLPQNPNEKVQTPLGEVRAEVVMRFCRAERVYIADITDVESYTATYSGRIRVLSDVQLTILHPLKGQYPSPVYVEQIAGGRVGNTVMRSSHAALSPTIGKRYVLSQQHITNPQTNSTFWHLTASIELDATAQIPADVATQFMQHVEQYCPAEQVQ